MPAGRVHASASPPNLRAGQGVNADLSARGRFHAAALGNGRQSREGIAPRIWAGEGGRAGEYTSLLPGLLNGSAYTTCTLQPIAHYAQRAISYLVLRGLDWWHKTSMVYTNYFWTLVAFCIVPLLSAGDLRYAAVNRGRTEC